MIFSNTFDINGKFHWQVLCRIAALNSFLELHRWYFTGNFPKTFGGAIFLIRKSTGASVLRYDKSMRPFKACVTRERGEGMLTKKVTKSDLGGRGRSQKVMPLTQKNEILRVTCFLNDPYETDLFCCIFMRVFVYDVISFL